MSLMIATKALYSFFKNDDDGYFFKAREEEVKPLDSTPTEEGLNPAAFCFQEYAKKFFSDSIYNLLVATPTSSGKSAVGFHWLKEAGGGLWVVDSSALALQMYDRLCKEFGRDAVGIGMNGYPLERSDFEHGEMKYAVITHFKLQELMGQFSRGKFHKTFPVVVWDEVDRLDFKKDLIFTELKFEFSSVRILALSGTIAKEDRPNLARYCHAEYIESNIRPVELEFHSVLFPSTRDGDVEASFKIRSKKTPERTVKLPDVPKKSSARPATLIYNYLRSVEADASIMMFSQRQRLAESVLRYLVKQAQAKKEKPDPELVEAARKLPNGGSRGDKLLKTALLYGYGLIHGGISHLGKQSTLRLYEKKKLKTLMVCLAGIRGLNLPARYFVMCSARDPKFSKRSPLMDVSMAHQGGGRAGRAGLDDRGHVYIPCRTLMERREVEEVIFSNSASYIYSSPKNICDMSVTVARMIRRGQRTRGKLMDFMLNTYWGMFIAERSVVLRTTNDAIQSLKDFGKKNKDHERKRVQLLDPEKDHLWLTPDGMALARLALTPDEFSTVMSLTSAYAALDELGTRELGEISADGFEIWVELFSDSYIAMEGISREDLEESIAEVKQYGMAVFSLPNASYHSRGLIIYVRRMLDKSDSYLNHYGLPDGWKEWWRENIYARGTYGELQLAYALVKAVGIGKAMVRRLIRDGLLTNDTVKGEIQSEQLIDFARCLYGVDCRKPGQNSMESVASALGCTKTCWETAIDQALNRKEV